MADRQWVCARCDFVGHHDDRHWPPGWSITTRPNKSGDLDLCPDCTEELTVWWELPAQVLAAQSDGQDAPVSDAGTIEP